MKGPVSPKKTGASPMRFTTGLQSRTRHCVARAVGVAFLSLYSSSFGRAQDAGMRLQFEVASVKLHAPASIDGSIERAGITEAAGYPLDSGSPRM
jgi:hypothetical protein